MIRFTCSPRHTFKLCILLMLVVLDGWTHGALAAATNCTSAGGSLTLPAVTLPSNPPVGTLLGSPASVTVTFTCSNLPNVDPATDPSGYGLTATIQAGLLAPADPTDNPNGNNGIMFATNLPGLALQLTASPIQANDRAWIRGGPGSTRGFEPGSVTAPASAWQCDKHGRNCTGTYTGSASETLMAQLIVTGPVTAGTLSAINLMQFNWYVYGIGPSQGYFASLVLNSATVSSPACTIRVDPTVVILPTVFSSNFGSLGSTAGQTPFNVQLNCSASSPLSITLSPSSPPYAGASGVLTNTTGGGYAQNVGVQVLDNNGNPISFGTAISVGPTINGVFNIPLQARYYQTGTPVSAGQVTATATYTLTYQ